ncbi:MAG: class I SAM-dependent methyltransferase [Desulfobacterales bacterium]|nr:class I SAM-dependent methyltransferase [Desulfobacterales bacterium]
MPVMVLVNTKKGWHIKRCPSCKITFADPQPSDREINDYYNGMYSELASDFSEQKMQWARGSLSAYLEVISRYGFAERRHFLDLGGGLGYCSKAAEERGLSVTLVEQDPVSAGFAKSVLGLRDVREQSIDDFCFESKGGKYDLIFLRHVIEHTRYPAKLIECISTLLKTRGVLVVETDNNAGIELLFRLGTARFYLRLYDSSYSPSSFLSLLIRRPFAVDPPRHLFGFRMSNLSRLLESHSLTPFKKVHYRLGHSIYWPNLPLPEVKSIATELLHFNWLKVIAYATDYCLSPLRLVLQVLGLSSGICIYAAKR